MNGGDSPGNVGGRFNDDEKQPERLCRDLTRRACLTEAHAYTACAVTLSESEGSEDARNPSLRSEPTVGHLPASESSSLS